MNPTGKHRPKRRHHGEGTVVERKDVYPAGHPRAGQRRYHAKPWAAIVPYLDQQGRRREKWLSATSRAEAESLRRDELRKIRAGSQPDRPDTLAAYLRRWLVTVADTRTPATWDRYTQHVEQRIVPTLGALSLYDLTPTRIRAAMAGWQGSSSTRGATLVVLRSALKAAVEDGLLLEDPTRGVRGPRRVTASPTVLDPDQARALLAAVEGEAFGPILVVSLGLGLRRGEALGLRTPDVDFRADTLRVGHQLRRIPPALRGEKEASTRIVGPKAGSSGTLPMPAFVTSALRQRIADRDAAKRKPYALNDFVFCDEHGNAVPFTSLDRWFKAMLRKAELPTMRWHELRHSTGTLLLAEGVPERVVQEILRHRSGEMTRRYMTVLPRVGRDAADRLDRALAR